MEIGANSSALLGLFNSSSNSASSNGIINIDLSALLPAGGASSGAPTGPTGPTPPTPPWSQSETATQVNANVENALAGLPIINPAKAPPSGGQGISAADASDYGKLFTLYQGLSALNDIVTQAKSTSQSPQQQAQLAKAFSSGLGQIQSFVSSTNFNGLRLAFGGDASSAKATLETSKPPTTYLTPPLATNDTLDVPALDGNVQFNIAVKLNSTTKNIAIDLSGLGSAPRSLGNVVNYINQQLSAAGVQTRVAINRTPGSAQTITAGGSTVTLPPTPDEFALQVNIGTSEQVTFSAPQTAGAVYVGQTIGNPTPAPTPGANGKLITPAPDTRSQLLKFQTDTTNVDAPPQIAGQANFTPGRVFANNLDPKVGAVHATQVGPDGSVYLLADVSGVVEGQSILGSQDVALLKYDSAGHLIYTRTLGASSSASGLGLAVSSTGQVAVVGSVTGGLTGATEGPLNSDLNSSFSTDSDSFVTLYDTNGNEVWTERRGATQNDQANQVAFSADGATVYVAGQAQGAIPGGGAQIGGQDGYIEAFQTSATGTPHATFAQTFGTAGQDSTKGLVVDGNSLITASVESGDAVLRNYDISSGTPVLTNTRDLGSLQGGTIAGLALNGGQVVVAGTTSNGALSAGAVTAPSTGGVDAFVAQVSASLTPSSSDAIAYYGGAGVTQATSLAVSNGQIWIGGQTTSSVSGQTFLGTKDGFIAQLDVSTGQVITSNEFTGKDGIAAPTSIAVSTTGASVLDRLGLPEGTLSGDTSQVLTAQSALRAGDQFTIATGKAPPVTITLTNSDTLASLAQEIQRATGNQATASVTSNAAGQQQLKITPAFAQATITLGNGPADKNALALLGLPQGILNQTTTINNVTAPADGGSKIYGLGLSGTLNFSSPNLVSQAQAAIISALGVVRSAYQGIVTAETPAIPGQPSATNPGKVGTVPAYLTAQIANLQAGLARLTGGNPTPSTSTFA